MAAEETSASGVPAAGGQLPLDPVSGHLGAAVGFRLLPGDGQFPGARGLHLQGAGRSGDGCRHGGRCRAGRRLVVVRVVGE